MDTVEKMIHRLPDGQFELVSRIRELFLAAHPEMTEQLHFSTPFFSCNGWLAYLSIYEDQGLEVNFVKGCRFTDPHNILVARKRKVVRGIVYNDLSEFNEDLFLEVLQQAVDINLQAKKTAKKRTSVK